MKINNILKPISVIKRDNSDQLNESIIRIDPLDDNPSDPRITMPNCPSFTTERKTNIFLIFILILTLANMAVFAYLFVTVYQYWKYSNAVDEKIPYTIDQLTNNINSQGSAL